MTSIVLCVKENDKTVQPLKEVVRISIQWLVTQTGNNKSLNKIDAHCGELVLRGSSLHFVHRGTDSCCSGMSYPGYWLQTALEEGVPPSGAQGRCVCCAV